MESVAAGSSNGGLAVLARVWMNGTVLPMLKRQSRISKYSCQSKGDSAFWLILQWSPAEAKATTPFTPGGAERPGAGQNGCKMIYKINEFIAEATAMHKWWSAPDQAHSDGTMDETHLKTLKCVWRWTLRASRSRKPLKKENVSF